MYISVIPRQVFLYNFQAAVAPVEIRLGKLVRYSPGDSEPSIQNSLFGQDGHGEIFRLAIGVIGFAFLLWRMLSRGQAGCTRRRVIVVEVGVA